MENVTCSYCGLPFKMRVARTSQSAPARQYFCCTGCAMLARVPVDEKGQFPVNTHLISALAAGFVFFNELLFWLLGTLLARQEKPALSERFLWIAAATALVVWGAIAFLQWREKSARATDVLFLAAVLAVHVWMCTASAPPAAWPMAVANAALIAWSMRGLLRKRAKA